MKKTRNIVIVIILIIICVIAIEAIVLRKNNEDKKGNNVSENNNTLINSSNNISESDNTLTEDKNKNNDEKTTVTIKPLSATLNVNSLKDCTFAGEFKASDVYLNDDGALVVHMKVMEYEMFDMVDIAKMNVDDIIIINGKNVTIKSIKRDGKTVKINGGIEENGYDLYTDEDGVYSEILENDARRYYSIGEATIPVDQEFTFVDNSDLDNRGTTSYAGDFLQEMKKSKKEFSANSTTVRVENGRIKNITINYIP